MKMQILDSDYVLVNNRPLIRLFGKTADGGTVCAFTDKLRPYFYLHVQEERIGEAAETIKGKFDLTEIRIVEKILPVGYSETPVKVLKIIGKDPSATPEMREFCSTLGTCYEADVLYKYRFMVDNKLKGMCWVEVEGQPEHTSSVKCKAIRADNITPIEVEENAPLKYMAFDIESISLDGGIPDASKDPIIMISCSFRPSYRGKERIVVLSKMAKPMDNVVNAPDEKEMLKKFLSILEDYDPDILIGYNINNFDLPYLIQRMEALNVPTVLGRADKKSFLRKFQNTYNISVLGRVVVDPYDIIKRDPYMNFKRYNLATVAKELLGDEKLDVGGIKGINEMWKGTQEDIEKLVRYCEKDSELAMRLVLDKFLLDRFIEIAKVSGLLLQDVFGGQTQRLECRILHEFSKRNYIMPCKPSSKEMAKRKIEREKAGLKGATVLEPTTGLHAEGCVLVLDFASLYPSIVKAFNLCPTTLLEEGEAEHFTSPYGTKFVKPSVREGVLPAIIKEFLESRWKAKKKMREETDPEKVKMWNAKQLALKIMANSLYGYTGYIRARLYVMAIANSITSYGRHSILSTKDIVEKNFPVKVVYGDTDSVFVKTKVKDLDEAQRLGEEISRFVTERLPGLRLEFEKIYKTFLILTKKRYVGWSFGKKGDVWKDRLEMKGIETVRRDWCILTSETMLRVLETILKEQDLKKASQYVRVVLQDLVAGKVPLEKLTVVKGVTKSLGAYDGIQPHVELAKKIMKRDPTRGSMVGERLGYVILKGNDLLSKRAEDPEFIKKNNLEIDSSYYVENQILPPIERIFDACGISRSELIEGVRQKNLFDMLAKKPASPEKTVLDGFDSVVCRKCRWSFRRPSLSGVCPKCSSQLYFSKNGSVGAMVRVRTF